MSKRFTDINDKSFKIETYKLKEENKPSYYAIIPASIRYNEKICANAKLLYGEITALSNKKGYCWAGNNYFSELYKVHKNTISKWIRQLKDNGYIQYKMTKGKYNNYIRLICISEKVNTPKQKELYPLTKRLTPLNEKVNNNTTVNNTINNTLIKEIECVKNAYPIKCPIKDSYTKRSVYNKEKLKKLIKKNGYNKCIEIINLYIDDCIKSKTYIKNFATFINNFPDINDFKSVIKTRSERKQELIKANPNMDIRIIEDILNNEE